MNRISISALLLVTLIGVSARISAQDSLVPAKNPIIWSDVPDPSIVRVGHNYFMSSTTMHMSPGVPIMKSENLVNWTLVNYVYDTLGSNNALSLQNGQQAYGRGSWASSLRFHAGIYYLSTFSSTTGKTHIYHTRDIENGPWEALSFKPSLHDNTLFFDDDGKIYMIWGGGKLNIVELKENLSGIKEGTEKVLIENASAPSGPDMMLPAEGSQLFKVSGKYYLFNISWPRDGMRTVIVHRADKITGPYEGRVVLQDRGIAQGGIVDSPEGKWYAYLFRDYGAVGRIPYLCPLKWVDGWPVLGENGIVPDDLDIMAKPQNLCGIVTSDEFNRDVSDDSFPLEWQWNHNPDSNNWSLTERPGFLRLKNGRIDQGFTETRNTLTQRTFGPECSGTIKIDVSGLREGGYAGLGALQKQYGFVGVKMADGRKQLIMVDGSLESPVEAASVVMDKNEVYLRIDMDFKNRNDKAYFYYSLDGRVWKRIGPELKMSYTLPHFMGYRFALFSYSTLQAGGYADFDWFRLESCLPQ